MSIALIALVVAVAFYVIHLNKDKILLQQLFNKKRTIYLQPFSDCSKEQVAYIYQRMQQNVPGLKLAGPVALPSTAWYAPRARYRADSIIHWLAKRTGDTVVYIGITTKDISTTSDGVKDWGVMGLGYEPGNACVVSTFRLSKRNTNDQLYKVCLHELGHNLGLPHCEVKSCFMRAGEGHNYTDEETAFCADCERKLEQKGLVFK